MKKISLLKFTNFAKYLAMQLVKFIFAFIMFVIVAIVFLLILHFLAFLVVISVVLYAYICNITNNNAVAIVITLSVLTSITYSIQHFVKKYFSNCDHDEIIKENDVDEDNETHSRN